MAQREPDVLTQGFYYIMSFSMVLYFRNNLESGLSLFSSRRETLVAPDHVTTQNLSGKKIGWQRWVAESGTVTVTILLSQGGKVKDVVLP